MLPASSLLPAVLVCLALACAPVVLAAAPALGARTDPEISRIPVHRTAIRLAVALTSLHRTTVKVYTVHASLVACLPVVIEDRMMSGLSWNLVNQTYIGLNRAA